MRVDHIGQVLSASFFTFDQAEKEVVPTMAVAKVDTL